MLLIEQIQAELKRQNRTIVILDDDPTGTQTVHNVPVLTEWSKEAIQREFEAKTSIFFILTNSRSLTTDIAKALNFEIGKNIKTAAKASNRDFYIISRGDSTLRGHFFDETDSLAQGLGWNTEGGYITALIPAFFEGNRFTKNDIHYWKNGEDWIPVGETPYAQDATFGYKNSDLKLWVEEKTKGKTKASEVISFDPNTVTPSRDDDGADAPSSQRHDKSVKGVDFSIEKLNTLKDNATLIVNALKYEDLEIFVLAALRSERRILYRTSASFVRAFAGILPKPLLTRKELVKNSRKKVGGLIVVGSHVPKTTAQLNKLLKTDIDPIEFNVSTLLIQNLPKEQSFWEVVEKIKKILRGGNNMVLYTSRSVILGKNQEESLQLSVRVSEALVWIVQNLRIQPAFLIAKGGITSSDLATKALGVKRALVLGQIAAGVPVWQLGEETKFPNMPYIVFPGNVGSDEDLKNVYNALKNKI